MRDLHSSLVISGPYSVEPFDDIAQARTALAAPARATIRCASRASEDTTNAAIQT